MVGIGRQGVVASVAKRENDYQKYSKGYRQKSSPEVMGCAADFVKVVKALSHNGLMPFCFL